VRAGGRSPRFVRADEAATAAGEAVAELARANGTVGVVVPPALRRAVEEQVRGTEGVTLLDPPDAKGLEFDAVVVVEPGAIAGPTARGLRLLYVALTRAVQELVVVHAAPLPAGLAA
jgi:superfamily I DNA/RNA helicase